MDTTLKIIFVIYFKQQQSSTEPFSLHFEFSFRYNHNVMVMEEKKNEDQTPLLIKKWSRYTVGVIFDNNNTYMVLFWYTDF